MSGLYTIFNMIMKDGSRHFSDLPQTVDWYELRDYIWETPDYVLTNFITDHVTEAWIDFDYKEHHFSVNTQMGAYWFFVDDPNCPDEILDEVMWHCSLKIFLRPAKPNEGSNS